jgi:uncharacterized protein with von Willebrand factor type A (vWA) domain
VSNFDTVIERLDDINDRLARHQRAETVTSEFVIFWIFHVPVRALCVGLLAWVIFR